MIVDTSALLAFFDRAEPRHPECLTLLGETEEDLVVSPFVLAELDYLVASRLGVDVEIAVLTELTGGAWDLATMSADEVRTCTSVIDRYADQAIGLADASNVVLAARTRSRTIATLDHRHFDVLRPLDGGRFRVLPLRGSER